MKMDPEQAKKLVLSWVVEMNDLNSLGEELMKRMTVHHAMLNSQIEQYSHLSQGGMMNKEQSSDMRLKMENSLTTVLDTIDELVVMVGKVDAIKLKAKNAIRDGL